LKSLSLSLSALSASSVTSTPRQATFSLSPPLCPSLPSPLSLIASIFNKTMPGEEQQTAAATPMLALDAAPSESAPSWRARGAALVDALPYVDSLTPSERTLADRLIEAEVSGKKEGDV
jgi:hypothetical protein